ncbi:transposase [Algoriphagus sp. 4150]|uniref:transposase n=1 Tax=Algoriphagus sp. 4150 TaxID=2817756 RepID=UPI0038D35540
MLFLKPKGPGDATGMGFEDSTPLRYYHNRRIHKHKTFIGIAEREQCSLGWFFRFKIHLLNNNTGKI